MRCPHEAAPAACESTSDVDRNVDDLTLRLALDPGETWEASLPL